MPARPLAAAVLGLLLLAAAPASAAGPVVGGDRLAGTGVVVDPAAPAPPEVSAASYVVVDLGTGRVLAAKDAHGAYAPASTLKTLTALALMPRLDPAAQLTPSQADVDVDGSKVGLVPSMSYTVKDLFTALLVVSANDAARTLASGAGGQAATVALMNAEAAHLQARDTRAVDPSGLDADGQVTSAYDLALIARAGLALPAFREDVALRRGFVPAPGGATIEIGNHNRLLASYPGAIGVKNGFTEAARASYVGAATRDGATVLVALMRAQPAFWPEAAALLDWGFAHRDAPPVGTLVGPAAPAAPSAGTSPPARAAVPPAPAAAAAADHGGSGPLVPALGTVGALGLAVVLRRRHVVRARADRRRAVRP